MAVLTLHNESATSGGKSGSERNLGNFIDLSTEEVRLFQQPEKGVDRVFEAMKETINRVPGAVLATTSDVDIQLRVINLSNRDWDESVDASKFPDEQRAFDFTTYASVFGSDTVNPPDSDFNEVTLGSDEFNPGVGTRFVLRFADSTRATKYRYFRVLIHAVEGESDGTTVIAFGGSRTVLQFEELVPNRALVPLALAGRGRGFQIATPENIHHTITKSTREVVWSLRPRERDFVGPATYDRPFPVATIAFQKWIEGRPWQDYVWGATSPRSPQWVDSVVQRTITSRSYLNSTYSLTINHGERPPSDPNHPQYHRTTHIETNDPESPSFSRFKYNVYFVDGSTLEVEDWDPTADVEDEM